MGNVAIIAVFFVLIASFAISVWSVRHRVSTLLQDFLFRGNTPLLALSSCIGSIISMAVSFTALLSAGYVWGWQIIFPMSAGCLTGLLAILKLSSHADMIAHEKRVERGEYLHGASYLAVMQGRPTQSYYWFSIAAYTAMLLTEIVVLRTFIGFVTDLPTFELVLMIGTVLLVCHSYVYIGGFRGVLVTDYFQLLIVFVFVGLWLTTVSFQPSFHIPPMTASRLSFTPLTRVLLHGGIFAGGLAWTFAGTDQWYRTLGTLKISLAKKILKAASIALCVFGFVPVLAGASAVGRAGVPTALTNGISLFLVADLLTHSSVTLRFVFAMALTCAGLTTLNTYIMTMQQLYYEVSTRVDSKRVLHYLIVNYPMKWKGVRGFVGVLTASAFVISCYFPERYVYAFGVLSLSCFILMLPFVTGALLQTIAVSGKGGVARLAESSSRRLLSRGALLVATAVGTWLALLYTTRLAIGPLTLHLYLIPATAFAAAIVASAMAIAFASRRILA